MSEPNSGTNVPKGPKLGPNWFRCGPAKVHCPACQSLRTAYVEDTTGMYFFCNACDHRWP